MTPEERNARRGTANPERVVCAHWARLVKTGESAWALSRDAGGPSSFGGNALWAFDRFGMATVELPDGRVLHVAGEHEDWYDPDFWIYNDVVIEHPDGSVTFWLYPVDVFPPTDFHSATLVGDMLVLVGSLGYPSDRRAGVTPIVVLDTIRGEARQVEGSGEGPGWIHEHTATLTDDGAAILVEGGLVHDADGDRVDNIDLWRLELHTWRWTRLTTRSWPCVALSRSDGERLKLWEHRQWLWGHENPRFRGSVEYPEPADVDALRALYTTSFGPCTQEEDAFDVWHASVHGVPVRFVEGARDVRVHGHGELDPSVLDALVAEVRGGLERALGTSMQVRRIR